MIAKTSWLLAFSLVFATVRSFASTVSINIIDLQFAPQTVTVNQGDTVQWANTETFIHTTTSDTGVWDSGDMASGQSFSRVFDTAGTFTFHCIFHPFMTGSVIVNSPSPPPTQTQTGFSVVGSLLTINLTAGVNLGKNADWWLVALAPSKHWFSFIASTNTWVNIGTDLSLVTPAYQGPLFDIPSYALFDITDIHSGPYVLYFGVDTNMNGVLDIDQLTYSSFSLNAP